MDTDLIRQQQEAERRVRRMQEHSRRLMENGPTFGAGAACPAVKSPVKNSQVTRSPAAKSPETDDHWLILLLILLLSQNGGNRALLTVLAYLAL